jgi:hypothetical protein
MTTTETTGAALADYARVTSGLAAAILLMLLGVPFFGAGVSRALNDVGAGLGIMAFSMIFNLPAILILGNRMKRKREREHVLVFADRVERRTAAGTQVFPFSALERIDAKIVSYQNSGNTYHSYRLPFGALGLVTIETNTHEGVDGEAGRLLMRLSGKSITPWS